MLKVISNTTPIISLLKIGKLNLLEKIYHEIIIPTAVYNEIEKGKDKLFYTDLRQIKWIKILEIQDKMALHYFFDLDAGESEVIVLANEIAADIVIIDEILGRRFAHNAGLKVTGTLAILIKAKALGYIEMVSPLLDELNRKGVWMSNKLREKVLKMVGE